MAHFAKLDDNNIVIDVLVVSDVDTSDNNGNEVESIGVSFCQKLVGDESTVWKQTSLNAKGNGFRGNYAGVGHTYMTNVRTMGVASTDVFVDQQPYPSWSIGVDKAWWYAPIPRPELTDSEIEARKIYRWNEDAYQADTNNPKTVGWALTIR